MLPRSNIHRLGVALLLTAPLVSIHGQADSLSEVVKWACSQENGGWMSDKIEIRPIGNDGLSGIFTKEPLENGEVVLDIPWSLIIRPPADSDWCDKVEHIRSIITKDPHQQTPYERYLATRTSNKPAIFWSRAGKELLADLMDDFPYKGFQSDEKASHQSECNVYPSASHIDAMMLLQTRGEGDAIDLLVPIGDLLNHRNGPHTNVDPSLIYGERYQIITTRSVQAGEQLQNSYNQCQWCRMYSNPKTTHDYYVTPQIFEVYGFVELPPQRWVVPRVRLLFDIVEAADGTPQVHFAVPPSKAGLHFLKNRLVALQQFKDTHKLEDRTDLPAEEAEALMTFHAACVNAFQLALEQAEGHTSERVWKMPKNQWYWEFHNTDRAKLQS